MSGSVLLAALLLAALMGFAIQRGGTCTVAAVDELLSQRRAGRLLALVEASAWVGGGLVIARALGWLGALPASHALGWATVGGAAMLGGGAYLNRACVFGSVAKLSNGDTAYLATPLGFFVGCLGFAAWQGDVNPPPLPGSSLLLQAPSWLAWLIAAAMLWRVLAALRAEPGALSLRTTWRRWLSAIWSPWPATVVIGVAFLCLLLIAGEWAYTEVLAEWARSMMGASRTRVLLLAALFGGAAWGGFSAGHLRWVTPRAAQLLRCFTGGALMGWGSQWTPGGNDGLILMGMPLLQPYAWLAFLTMVASLVALMRLQQLLASRTRAGAA